MARKFILKRSGDRALSFEGKLIAKAGGQGEYGDAKERWHELALYHTASDRYVASVEFHATWEGEEEWFVAFVADEPTKLIEQLQEHDPYACIFGYPDTQQFKSRNEQLRRVIQTRYDNALAEILATARKKLGDLGEDFVEMV